MNSIKSKTKEGVEIEIIISDHAIKNGTFKIGDATDLQMILKDIQNETYVANTFLKKGWTNDDLQSIISETILNCDDDVKSIKAELQGVVALN